jgi:hypothetical protein
MLQQQFSYFLLSTSSFLTLSHAESTFILTILYNHCLLPAQYCYIIVYKLKIDSGVQIADQCPPWKISSDVDNLLLQMMQF